MFTASVSAEKLFRSDNLSVFRQVTGSNDKMMKKRVVTFCLAVMWCMTAQVYAQNDTLGCNAQASYTYQTDPSGATTFTAQYSGMTNPVLVWSVNGNQVGSGDTYTGTIPDSSEVCLEATDYTATYDSLQGNTNIDTCYAIYCAWFSIQEPPMGCNAQAAYTYSTNPNGQTTFYAQYSGITNPQLLWYVGGNIVATGPAYTANLNSGTEVCLIATGFATFYDSLQQNTYTDSCMAFFCDVITTVPSNGCNLQAYYTYSTDLNGQTTFSGQYSGTGNPYFFWLVNGNYVGNNQSTFTATLAPGTEVCFEVRDYNWGYDSLTQEPYSDTCFATYCSLIGTNDSLNGCNLQAGYTYFPDSLNPASTIFVGQYSGTNNPVFFWMIDGNYVGNGQSYLVANVPPGSEVCFEVREYNWGYDSLTQEPYSDTCFAYHCEVMGTAALAARDQAGFTLYPNPAKTTLSLIPETGTEISQVVILDLNGRTIITAEQADHLDVSAIRQGIYYVKIMTADGRWSPGTQKFVKE